MIKGLLLNVSNLEHFLLEFQKTGNSSFLSLESYSVGLGSTSLFLHKAKVQPSKNSFISQLGRALFLVIGLELLPLFLLITTLK